MKYADLLRLVENSERRDWKIVDHAVLEGWSFTTTFPLKRGPKSAFLSKDEITRLEPEYHNGYAVFKNDVNITMAWGKQHHDEYRAIWLDKNPFPDKSVSSIFVDLYYGGQVMWRWIVIYMDGAREVILQPSVETVPGASGDKAEDYDYFIPTKKFPLLRLLTGLLLPIKPRFATRQAQDLLRRLKMEVRDPKKEEWDDDEEQAPED